MAPRNGAQPTAHAPTSQCAPAVSGQHEAFYHPPATLDPPRAASFNCQTRNDHNELSQTCKPRGHSTVCVFTCFPLCRSPNACAAWFHWYTSWAIPGLGEGLKAHRTRLVTTRKQQQVHHRANHQPRNQENKQTRFIFRTRLQLNTAQQHRPMTEASAPHCGSTSPWHHQQQQLLRGHPLAAYGSIRQIACAAANPAAETLVLCARLSAYACQPGCSAEFDHKPEISTNCPVHIAQFILPRLYYVLRNMSLEQ